MKSVSRAKTSFGIGGVLKVNAYLPRADVDKAYFSGLQNYQETDLGEIILVQGERHNAFVNTGLEVTLDRLYALNGPPAEINYMGITDDVNAVTATTTVLDPAADNNVTIVTLTSKSRTNQTVAADASFTKANANFIIRKVGLLNTATDAGTGLINVIGGGGTAPYNESFAIDLTGATSFNLTLGIDVTATAS